MPSIIQLRPVLLRSPPVVATSSAMSLVLAAASSQYLSRTWGASPTNDNKATISFFIKRVSVQSTFANFYDGGQWHAGPQGEADIRFGFGDDIAQVTYDGGAVLSNFQSTNTVTDTTTWHHILVSYDSTQATANNRLKIYLDGVEVSYGTQTAPTQNTSFHLVDSGIASAIGRHQDTGGRYLDAKLAYFYLIDGQALTPSSFTTGTGSGTTHPATYGGTYGTNGFFLNFSSSNTNDQSGNGNNWTQNASPTFSSDIPT